MAKRRSGATRVDAIVASCATRGVHASTSDWSSALFASRRTSAALDASTVDASGPRSGSSSPRSSSRLFETRRRLELGRVQSVGSRSASRTACLARSDTAGGRRPRRARRPPRARHGDGGDGGGDGGSLPAHRIEAVFTGDAIINGGVGAFFHGDAKDCYDNLHVRLKRVPDAALVFSGHEYMLMNLRFSHWLDESDENVATALREVATRRHHSFTTQPSSMAVERRVNPFFRVKERAFLDKIEDLYVAMRRSARKKWYRRYVPDWLDRSTFIATVEGPDKRDAEMGKLARKLGQTGPYFADISRDPDEPSAIECVKGIKTCQELIQYRHAIDQATAGEGGAEVDEDESPAAEAPEPGPVRVDA